MSEKSWRNRVIMGSAISAAGIAVILDHTRHPLPEPEPAVVIVEPGSMARVTDNGAAVVIVPCGLGSVSTHSSSGPCSLGAAPCSLSSSPCSL